MRIHEYGRGFLRDAAPVHLSGVTGCIGETGKMSVHQAA